MVEIYIQSLSSRPAILLSQCFYVYKGSGLNTNQGTVAFRHGKSGDLGDSGQQKFLQIAEDLNKKIKQCLHKSIQMSKFSILKPQKGNLRLKSCWRVLFALSCCKILRIVYKIIITFFMSGCIGLLILLKLAKKYQAGPQQSEDNSSQEKSLNTSIGQ